MAKQERKKTTIQRRVPRGNESPEDVRSLYPKATPTDESGLPRVSVDVDEKTVREIGAVDAKSARVTKQSRLVLARKAKGEWCKWNDDDDAIRFWECAQIWGGCMIEVKRLSPTPDESIPDMSMSIFQGDFGQFKRRIREMHWDGRAATYTWRCYDRTHPQLACGQLEFGDQRSDDMNHNRQQPPGGGYPYPPQNPYGPGPMPPQNPYGGMYGGNPYGMPFGGAPFPQQQVNPFTGQVGAAFEQPVQPQQQQVPQPQYQQPQPPPPPAPPPVTQGSDANLVQMLMYLSAQLSHAQQQNAFLQQQLMQIQAQQQQGPQIHPSINKDEKKEEVTPLSPVAALKESLNNAKEVMQEGKNFAKVFAPEQPETEETETKEPEPPFPIQAKEIAGVTLLAENGEVVRDFWPNALANSGKAMAMGMGFFDKIAGMVTKAAEAQKKVDNEADKAVERAEKLARIDKERAESAERAARARREIANTPVPQVVVVGTPSENMQPISVQPVSVAPSEPEAEPFPFVKNPEEQPGPPPNGSAST